MINKKKNLNIDQLLKLVILEKEKKAKKLWNLYSSSRKLPTIKNYSDEKILNWNED